MSVMYFFNDTATTEIYTLSLHDALPISPVRGRTASRRTRHTSSATPVTTSAMSARRRRDAASTLRSSLGRVRGDGRRVDRKSTRLNSSHANISYAVFCLKKKDHVYDREH